MIKDKCSVSVGISLAKFYVEVSDIISIKTQQYSLSILMINNIVYDSDIMTFAKLFYYEYEVYDQSLI